MNIDRKLAQGKFGYIFIFMAKLEKNINLFYPFQFISILKQHCLNIMICSSIIIKLCHKSFIAFVISSKTILILTFSGL